MRSKNELGEDIFSELIDLQGLSPHEIIEHDDFKLPRIISVGSGRSIQISKTMDDLISELAARLRDGRPQLAKVVKQDEWRSWVRNAVGPAVAKIDLSIPPHEVGSSIVAAVESTLEEQLAGLVGREHAFGANIFSNKDIPPFFIGPVKIETATDWLARKTVEGHVKQATARRILKAWNGVRVVQRKNRLEAAREKNILDAIAGAPYVVSVELQGFAGGAGLDAAATAARLALVCIALLWERPSDALQGLRLRFDPGVRRQRSLTFVPGGIVISGSMLRGHPFGPTVKIDEWQTTLANAAPVFAACAEAIAYLVSPDGAKPRANLMNAIAQALLWFHAACREESDAFAVVNFSACLDALSGGRKAVGIMQLLEARLDVKPTTPINASGATFKSTVDRIYNDGRSRTVHGTSARVGHDWTETRGLAEQLARLALIQCLDLLGDDPTVASTEQLRR